MESHSAQTLPSGKKLFVAIGASAGGLEAIGSFFSNLPSNTGCTFIVIQHLSPDYKSLMSDLLSRHTDMPVLEVVDGVIAEKNHVYLIPPKKNLTIFHEQLLLSEQKRTNEINLPIDLFLQSLATDQGSKSVAIILSGTGSDGSRGVRAIKEKGGIVMVQSSDSAKFSGMPDAARDTGLVDITNTPEGLAEDLVTFVESADRESLIEVLARDKKAENATTRIFSVLREKTRVDFSHYKSNTVMRRIERRILVNKCSNLAEYVTLVSSDSSEAQALHRELLIGVTRFFRDEESFESVKKHCIGPLIDNSLSNEEIRIWVVGCSTGEEAYTLAILFKEVMKAKNVSRNVKVFATDIDIDAIAVGQNGIYPESISADISPRILSSYFQKVNRGFQINRDIREMVIFAQHNIVGDPPFRQMSMVTCRNVLIYLKSAIQRTILATYNFSLKDNGYLFLGNSESIGESTDLFSTIDSRNKIFQTTGRKHYLFSENKLTYGTPKSPKATPFHRQGSLSQDHILEKFYDALAEEFLPATLLVNEQLEILHIIGDATRYISFPSGQPVNDISRLAKKGLRVCIVTGIKKALRTKETLRFSNVPLDDGTAEAVHVRIKPIFPGTRSHAFAALMIEPLEQPASAMDGGNDVIASYSEDQKNQISDLEQELQYTRESLQATIQELETANEELQATNEELLSSNEELQSTNEELQSTNEELYTVNAEYQDKLHELAETNAEIDNLLLSINSGILIVDENLIIRRFSDKIKDVFKVMNTDVGRPLTHLQNTLVNCDPVALAKQVATTEVSIEVEAATSDNKYYILKIVPFTVGQNKASTGGAVITLVDISYVKRLGSDIKQLEQHYRLLFDNIDQGIVYSDAEGVIVSTNVVASDILGRKPEEIVGQKVSDPSWRVVNQSGQVIPFEKIPAERSRREKITIHNEIIGFYFPEEEKTKWLEITTIPLFKNNNEFFRVLSIFRDATQRAERSHDQNTLIRRLELIPLYTDISWWEWDIARQKELISPQHFNWFDILSINDTMENKIWEKLLDQQNLEKIRKAKQELLQSGSAQIQELKITTKEGSSHPCFFLASITKRSDDQTPLRATGVLGIHSQKLKHFLKSS